MRSLRFRAFAWVATAGVAMAVSYLISHQVSSERTELDNVNAKIARAHRDIRALRTELGTRASMRQLERWNADVMQLATPDANQFLSSDKMLAALNSHGILSGAQGGPPVMVEAMRSDQAKSAPASRIASDVNIAAEVVERRETRKKMLAEAPGDSARIALKPDSKGSAVTKKAPPKPDHDRRVASLEAGVFGNGAKKKPESQGKAAIPAKISANKVTAPTVKKDVAGNKAPRSGGPANLLDQIKSRPSASKPAASKAVTRTIGQ